ncbi:hypothetical protein A3F06_01140 [candidate division TM6 bacterium RIFCSPHIGHO2_12_FULL_36_22]|nr:MAG: hypothetical protein A3F06_01140 [candidate division TM6 bacterium RIFCSPHIGHO2_12_FULL_36_22]
MKKIIIILGIIVVTLSKSAPIDDVSTLYPIKSPLLALLIKKGKQKLAALQAFGLLLDGNKFVEYLSGLSTEVRKPVIKAYITKNPYTYALIIAAQEDNLSVVEALLNAGTDPNVQSNTNDTALMFTAENNNLAITRALLAGGADPNLLNNDGMTAIKFAQLNKNLEIEQELLAAGAKPDLKQDDNNPLIIAIKDAIRTSSNSVEKIAKLEKILTLVDNPSTNINVQDSNNNTPLMLSLFNDMQPIVQALIKRGVKPNLRNADGQTALMIASVIGYSGHIKVPFVGIMNPFGPTLKQAQPGIVELFLGYKSATQQAKEESYHMYYEEIVQALLSNGSNPNIQDNFGLTALMMASKRIITNIVNLLLKYGANPDIQNEKGDTALMDAAYSGNVEIAYILIKAGASLNLTNIQNKTALKIAQERGNTQIADLLKEHGAQE